MNNKYYIINTEKTLRWNALKTWIKITKDVCMLTEIPGRHTLLICYRRYSEPLNIRSAVIFYTVIFYLRKCGIRNGNGELGNYYESVNRNPSTIGFRVRLGALSEHTPSEWSVVSVVSAKRHLVLAWVN